MTITARYENGIFRPLETVLIEEGTVVEVRVPERSELQRDRQPVSEMPFFGLWADRDDISDGVAYVDHLRDHPRG